MEVKEINARTTYGNVKFMAADAQYTSVLENLLSTGVRKVARGHTRLSIPSASLSFPSVAIAMPLVRSKKLFLRKMLRELLFFCAGRTDVAHLKERNVDIWNQWEKADGSLGPVYGSQWRNWKDVQTTQDTQHRKYLEEVGYCLKGSYETETGTEYVLEKTWDQIAEIFELLGTDSGSSRMLCSAWNFGKIHEMALPPCHVLFQCVVEDIAPNTFEHDVLSTGDYFPKVLHMNMYQRSADWALGVPFNLASYATLQQIIAAIWNMVPGSFNPHFGDCHIYEDQIDGSKQILEQYNQMCKDDVALLAEYDGELPAQLFPKLTITIPQYIMDIEDKLEAFDAFIEFADSADDDMLFTIFDYQYTSMPAVQFPLAAV